MKNSEYWRKRIDEIAKLQYEKADKAEKELVKAYERADKYIDERIKLFYSKYATDYGISLIDSEKLLSVTELHNFRMSLEEFIEKAQNNDDNKWTKELDQEYLRSRISRYQALKIEINNKINELKHEQNNITRWHLKDVFTDTYYRTAYEIEKGTGTGVNFAKLNDEAIEKAIYTKWLDDKNFAGRMNDDKINLINNLNKIITQGLIIGSSQNEMIDKLMKATHTSKRRASTLIQTETAFVIGQANTKMYKEFGVEEYDVIETLDSITCETCRSMDEKRFKVSEKQEGLNAPPFHPKCRGTTVPVSKYEKIWGEDTRVATDNEGNTFYKTNIKNMSYEDFMEYHGIDYSVPADEGTIENIKFDISTLKLQDITNSKEELINNSFENKNFREIVKSANIRKIKVGAIKSSHLAGNIKFDKYFTDRTVRHELGHAVDYNYGWLSSSKSFLEAIRKDKEYLNNNLDLYKILVRKNKKMYALSDIISALSKGKINGRYYHDEIYWKKKNKVQREVFTELFSVAGNDDFGQLKVIQKYFPNIFKEFDKLIGGLIKNV